MKPMLAFKTKASKLTYPVFIQPKYNGVRALYLRLHKNLQSRDEHLWEPSVVEHLLTQLTSLPFDVDGELYKHGMSLQMINARIAVNRVQPHDKAAEVHYYIYDIPMIKPMWERAKALVKLAEHFKDNPVIKVAETHLVYSQLEADHYYANWKAEGYEGLMYRTYDAPYGFSHNCGNKENRWWHLQKRKEFLDLEATIVGLNEGEDGFAGMLGSFDCVTEDGVHFSAGSGLDMEQRQRYWQDPGRVLEAKVRINYEMFSDGGVPLKPTIESVNELY